MRILYFLNKEMRYRNFIILFIILFLFMISPIAIINYIVDPYGIYHPDYIQKKPFINTHTRLHKTQRLLSRDYECIFLGTSRVEGLFDFEFFEKEHLFFQICKTYYNAGISSASVEEVSEFLKLILKFNQPRIVFYGLDFVQFSAPIIESKRSFLSYYRKPYYHRIVVPFSLDTLWNSVKTINSTGISYYKENGSWNIDKEMESKNFSIFLESNILNLKQLFLLNEKAYYNNFYHNFSLNMRDGKSTLFYYRQILENAYKNKIKFYLFINPFHIRLIEVLDRKIGYNRFEDWKRDIVKLNEEIANLFNTQPYPVYDFSGYNFITSEEIPVEGFKMKYFYYENSHIRPSAGDLMLKKILLNENQFNNFGILISTKNIEEHLEKQKELFYRWREENQVEVNEIINFINK